MRGRSAAGASLAVALVAFSAATVPAAVGASTPRPESKPVLPATLKDASGQRVVVKDTTRVVVLNGDIAEVVYALGQGARVVGTDTSATYPEQAKAKQTIGYQRSLSAEGILSLRPTLVIGNTTAGPAPAIEQIRAAGVPVVILPDSDRLSSVGGKIRNVARALGVPRRGAALATRAERQLDATLRIAARTTSRPTAAFLYVRGTRVQQIGGAGSRGDVVLKAARARDVGAETGIKGFKQLTAEALVKAQPDYIVLPSAGLGSVGGVNGLLRLPGVAQTPAGRNKAIIAFDDQYLLGLGPRTAQAVRDLTYALHPELKKK